MLAACHATAATAAAPGAGTILAAAARPRPLLLSCRALAETIARPRRRNLSVYALPGDQQSERQQHKRREDVREAESSTDEAGATAGDFAALAKQLTGQLAAELSSNQDSVYNKLEAWLRDSHEEEEADEVPPRTDQTTTESDSQRLLRLAAEYWGMPTTISDAVQSVKSWLSNPSEGEERSDTQMVARILHRLLQTYERQAGEDFRGTDHQYERLYAMARGVLGSSLSKRVLKRLVRAYLGI